MKKGGEGGSERGMGGGGREASLRSNHAMTEPRRISLRSYTIVGSHP